MNKVKYHFVYCRKTRNQVSRTTRYRKNAVKLHRMLDGKNRQYHIGFMVIGDAGIIATGPGRINLDSKLLPRAPLGQSC